MVFGISNRPVIAYVSARGLNNKKIRAYILNALLR